MKTIDFKLSLVKLPKPCNVAKMPLSSEGESGNMLKLPTLTVDPHLTTGMATKESTSATEGKEDDEAMLLKPLIESTKWFIKATQIPGRECGTILEAIDRLKVAQVDGMPDIVEAPLLVNAMKVIEAKGVTGTEAKFEFDKAATLIAKATELAWAGEDVDATRLDEVATSVSEVTGMTTSEVLSILTLPLVPDPGQYSNVEDYYSQVRAQAKDATSATEAERPDMDMAWFETAATSVAEATGLSKKRPR